MHHILESSVGEKCTCGNPASHKVEEVLDFGSFSSVEDAVNTGIRHPLTVYLCCRCFSKLMGDPFNWCGLTPLAPDAAKADPYFDPELPEEYIEGAIYHQKRRAGKANR